MLVRFLVDVDMLYLVLIVEERGVCFSVDD